MSSTQRRPSRILVYGVTGSGKTTLAARIGERLDLPWYAVDELTWEAGWVSVPAEIQRDRIGRICAGDVWVLDTAYGTWADIPLARADLVVGLDYPRWLTLSRLVRRTASRLVRKTPVCNDNRESWRNLLSANSILVWHFRSFSRKRERMRRWQRDPGMPTVAIFRRPSEVSAWLNAL